MTRKKSSNPVPNLRAVKTLLSGCPVTVSLSQSVTETPQESPKVLSSQHSHHDKFLSWLGDGRKSQYHPPITKEGRVGVVQHASVDLNDNSATLNADSEDKNIDSIMIDSSYTATADVHADNWKSDTW